MNLLANFFYFFLWTLGAVVFYTPFFIKNFIADFKARIWFHLLPFKKRILLLNLAHVFPREREESMDEFKNRLEVLCLQNMQHMVLCIMEFFERFHWSDRVVQDRVIVSGNEFFQRRVKEGQGFFILTAHQGNWELITRVGTFLKIRLKIVTKHLRNSFFDQLWVKSRTHYGLDLLKEEGSGLGVIRAVQKGASVGFILDQHTGEPHGLKAKFLGLDAWCPKGLAILSTRLKAPVIPAFISRLPDGRHHVEISEALDFSFLDAARFREEKSRRLNEEGILAHVEYCNRLIEQRIRTRPEQYLWIHRRFKGVINYQDKLPWEL